MTQYDDNNSGVLFVNDRKSSDKAPDYTGNITVNGKKLQLAGWKRQGKNGGKPFLSIKVSEFQKKDAGPNKNDGPANFDDSDSIPF